MYAFHRFSCRLPSLRINTEVTILWPCCIRKLPKIGIPLLQPREMSKYGKIT